MELIDEKTIQKPWRRKIRSTLRYKITLIKHWARLFNCIVLNKHMYEEYVQNYADEDKRTNPSFIKKPDELFYACVFCRLKKPPEMPSTINCRCVAFKEDQNDQKQT